VKSERKAKIKRKRLKSKLQMESAKIMLTLNEIESFEALDLELKKAKGYTQK
jgi:hypothetical protein